MWLSSTGLKHTPQDYDLLSVLFSTAERARRRSKRGQGFSFKDSSEHRLQDSLLIIYLSRAVYLYLLSACDVPGALLDAEEEKQEPVFTLIELNLYLGTQTK